MKIAILQYNPEFGEVEKNLKRVATLTENIEADLFVLPELFATGYLFETADELAHFAEPFKKGITGSFIHELAKKHNAAFIAGYPELAPEGFFNSAMFIMPDGKGHNYRKIHLFDREKTMFVPGDKPFEAIEFRGAKVGIMICFDWIFPESYRTLALKGADIVCHCTNLVLPFCQRASYAHAVSNRMFIVISNRIGTEERAGTRLDFTGQSVAYSPMGEVLCEFAPDEEFVRVFEIDPAQARAKFVTQRNHVLEDRRPDLYEI
jgi:predicted amidohydrolase